MLHFAAHDLQHLLTLYGYWAVIVLVGLESVGIPVPGETMLIAAALYAGSTHRLNIIVVIGAAALGAILGDNIGYAIGREGGYRLLRRLAGPLHISEAKLKVGQYLFRRHGGKVVFFGRFVALLRALAAFLAGTNRMRWPRFLVFNALGGIVWAGLYGMAAYAFGEQINNFEGPVGKILAGAAVVVIIIFIVVLRKNEARLEEEAERALPGPIEQYERRRRPKDADNHDDSSRAA